MTLLKTASALLVAAMAFGSETNPINSLVAHEWGTFTSVAGKDGLPVQWLTLGGPADLPCFVVSRGPRNVKGNTYALVRMETPVVYFYTPRRLSLSVRVDFPSGQITEWYPQATTEGGPRVEWKNVEVMPGADPEFPTGKGASHYYAARNTDAAPLRVGSQQEKLLFYRGLADFMVPVRPKFLGNGKIEIRNFGSDPIPSAILFENRDGKIGYRVLEGGIPDTVQLDPPELTGDLASLHTKLTDTLAEFGLYGKEAQAMIETWRDSWFEEGMRVLYIMPRSRVDSVLPIAIAPDPASLARVFVGRVEMLSPAMEKTLGTAFDQSDLGTLRKYGRFLEAFAAMMGKRGLPAAAQGLIDGWRSTQNSAAPSCVK